MTSPLLRHRPGRQTRMADLHRYLAEHPGSDPLAGNYTLVHLQDVVLNFQGLSEKYEMVALTAELSGDPPTQQPTLIETGQVTLGDSVQGKHLATTTGAFRGGSMASIASVYDDGGQLMVHIATNTDTNTNTDSTPASSLRIVASAPVATVAGACTVRLAAGRLIDSGADAFVIAWADDTDVAHLQVWATAADLTPSPQTAVVTFVIGGNAFDLAVGDIDQDGFDEVIVAWPGAADSDGSATLNLSVVDVGAEPGAQVAPPVEVALLGSSRSFAVATGSFNSTPAADQVAVAWGDENGLGNLVVFHGDGDGRLVQSGTPYTDTTFPLSGSMLVRLATGDVDFDGFDEIILGTVGERLGQDNVVILHILSADDVLQLTLQSVGAVGRTDVAFAQVDLALAYGGLGSAGSPAIVVAALGAAGLQPLLGIAQLNVGLVQVSGSGDLPPTIVEGVGDLVGGLTFEAQDPNLDLTVSMALGDFNGRSIRVGMPRHFTFDDVSTILAVVNAPPTQAGVNAIGGASLMFTDATQQQSAFNYTVNDGWTVSDELGVNLSTGLGQLTQSMNTTYGENFTNTSGSNQTYAQTVTDRLTDDDLILASGTSYDVWEYPVYASAAAPSPGCILVAFPNVAGPETFSRFGLTPSTPYAPDHTPGALLSYSSQPPADWTEVGAISQQFDLDINTTSQTVAYNATNGTTLQQSHTQTNNTVISDGVNLSKSFNFLGGLGIGLQARFSNTYMNSAMSNYSITYTDTTSITIVYESLSDPSQEYTVCPFVYFSDEGGFLVVDYVVGVPDGGYWSETFSTPSPQFNKPWTMSSDADLHDLTRSISFVAQADGSLKITARVGNYSFADAGDVQVRFYLGDPRTSGALPIGSPPPVAWIGAQQRQDVSVNWQPTPLEPGPTPAPAPPYRIYATIEPVDGTSFPSSTAYAVWPPPLWSSSHPTDSNPAVTTAKDHQCH